MWAAVPGRQLYHDLDGALIGRAKMNQRIGSQEASQPTRDMLLIVDSANWIRP